MNPEPSSSVRSRFSAAAQTYQDASRLQDRVARRLLELVPPGLSPASVLDVGCGSGRLTGLAAERWPEASLTGVDLAEGMIEEAGRRFPSTTIQWIQADAATFKPGIRYDLVISSSALHWLDPFAAGLHHVATLVAPGGHLALAVMLDGTLVELHHARKAAVPGKPPRRRLPTGDDFEAALRAIPDARVRRIERIIVEYDEPSAAHVLRTLHAMGVTGGAVSRGEVPLHRGDIRALCAYYDHNFRSPEGVRVTFVVGYALVRFNSH